MKLKSLTDTFFITNTPSIDDANEFERHVLDHQYSFHWRSWRVWQTRSFSPILPTLEELMSLRCTFLITNKPSIYEADEYHRHIFHHQYSLHWRSWRDWETNSWSPTLPPLKELKRLRNKFLITNTSSIEGVEEFDRRIRDHQYSLH